MRIERHLLFWVILLLSISACSILPKKVVPQSKLKTYQFLEQARKEELRANYTDALSVYTEAESNAILCNDFNAQLVAMQGKARVLYVKEDSIGYRATMSQMQKLVADVNPAYDYRILQITFWEYFRNGDYEKILQAEYSERRLPFNVRVEILSYKVQAQAYLKKTNPDDNIKLSNAVKTYYRKFKRSKNLQAEMISNAYYALAFSDAGNKQYAKALSKLKKAMLLDRDYDLYIQLADDYALAGLCEKEMGNTGKARAYYTIALQIYRELYMDKESNRIQAILTELPTENK